MGCNASKNKSRITERIMEYERQSLSYLGSLDKEPATIQPENYDHYISLTGFYNLVHAGFCGPYIANPNYLLIVDFRFIEEYAENHVATAIHHSQVDWISAIDESLRSYSSIILYDEDGASSANLRSFIKRTVKKLSAHQIDAFCLLGGIKALSQEFPHLVITSPQGSVHQKEAEIYACNSLPEFQEKRVLESKTLPWMPSLISVPQNATKPVFGVCEKSRLFLGRLEQANDPRVIHHLALTHIISVGRGPEMRQNQVSYLGFDGELNFYQTLIDACRLIRKLLLKNGQVLVHGIEGLNRSAAIIVGYLMISGPFLLDEAYFYLQVQRPFLSIDEESLRCLSEWERYIFGSEVTELDMLWK